MLDKMIEKQGTRNLLVFPEKYQSSFIFTIIKLLHNISSGKIKSSYDPFQFSPGERLKVGNAIVEYLGPNEEFYGDGLAIRLLDVDRLIAPVEQFPIFQKVDSKRKLSKFKLFAKERKTALEKLSSNSSGNQKVSYASDMKTHMDSSVFYMTTVIGAKEQLFNCWLDDQKVSEIFYVAQVNYDGEITNVSPGQMTGIPAIVLGPDLYAISAAAAKGHPVQSVIIDGSNTNSLLGQLDALDEVLQFNVPVACVTDVANSFELDEFIKRGFNVWRWDENSITPQLYNVVSLSSDEKIKNCAKQSVVYLQSDGEEISDAMKWLSLHRKETENQSAQMMRLFERLNGLTFSALRTTVPFSEIEINMAQHTLDECSELLSKESFYLSEDTIRDYTTIIEDLRKIYEGSYVFKKNLALKDYLENHKVSEIYLIVPEKSQKNQVEKYWSLWVLRNGIRTKIRTMFPSEYYSLQGKIGDETITIVSGWMKRAIMRKIIYCYNTSQYVVLLYDYEKRWQKHDSVRWKNALKKAGNKEIIEKSFSTDRVSISTERFRVETEPVSDTEDTTDELGEIELILHDNKFRQYVKGGSHGGELVNAIPVNFVGGYIAFYRTGHKIISATKIITTDSDKIEMKLPSELNTGDFVVVREADKDLIKEIADVILDNSNKDGLRELAAKWKEALQIELLFCTEDDFYERLKAAGCDKGIATVKRWIDDESIIAPQSKDDLEIIAKVTENELLLEKVDLIYEAAQEVRKAHTLAGRKLSEKLRLTLAEKLKKYDDIDPFNIWEPIEMNIEEIGIVKVLKVIDIGLEITVDAADTNRLIEE